VTILISMRRKIQRVECDTGEARGRH